MDNIQKAYVNVYILARSFATSYSALHALKNHCITS